jgi:hypothetical protein
MARAGTSPYEAKQRRKQGFLASLARLDDRDTQTVAVSELQASLKVRPVLADPWVVFSGQDAADACLLPSTQQRRLLKRGSETTPSLFVCNRI